MSKKNKRIMAAVGLAHSDMKIVEQVGRKLGLKVEYYRDLEDYKQTEDNELFQFPVMMQKSDLLKLDELIKNYNKLEKEDSTKLTDSQKKNVVLSVQLVKAISLLHGLTFHRDKELYAYLLDDQGRERKVKLTIEDAE